MPISLDVDIEHKILIVSYYGDIDYEQLCKDVSELVSLPDYNSTWDGISDFRNASVLYTSEDMVKFKDFVAALPGASTAKWAVIMPDMASYLETCPWEQLCKDTHEALTVCIDIRQARDWLLRYKTTRTQDIQY